MMAQKTPGKKSKKGAPQDSFRDEPLSEKLIERLLKDVRKPLRLDDFLRILGLPRRRKKELESYLRDLLASGRAVRLAGGGYALAAALKRVTGVLSVQRSGVGFVRLDPPAEGEAFISRHHLDQAWHGDRVEVVLFPDRRGKNRDGRIVRILKRSIKDLVVRVIRNRRDGASLCEPADARLTAMFLVDVSSLDTAPPKNSLLRIRPGESRGPGLWDATALAALGNEDDSSVQEQLVKASHAIPGAFPPDTLREAMALPKEPSGKNLAGRRDLSGLGFVTIDGDTARDFDDAVCVEKAPSGYVLYVAVADVAHYVRPGSALDDEAYLRGNSYYFPRSVEPMMPEALSNGLCSLNPGVPRLVMVAEMAFSAKGVPSKEAFYPAWIRSSARLTYDQVRDGLILGLQEARRSMAANLPMLENALALARILADARKARGSLDFDLPEPECRFDDSGKLIGVIPRENHFAHKLIEEFMVAANEAVARFLTDKGVPLLYRVHPAPDPDKLQNLFLVLSETGLMPQGMQANRKNAPPPSPGMLQALLDGAKGTPHEYLVSRVALRAMMQAGYSQDPDGHFGLASDCYCHFTSPIRRYADLIVHRSLKAALNTPDKTKLPGRKNLQAIAGHINVAERTAMEAEREIYRRMSVIHMSGHVGGTFPGIISGLAEFGIFVELDSVMAEGMVRLAELPDDYYVHYPDRHELRGERTGKTFRLGQLVEVTVTDVSLARLEINLAFARRADAGKPSGTEPARREKSKGPGKRASGNGKKPLRKKRV